MQLKKKIRIAQVTACAIAVLSCAVYVHSADEDRLTMLKRGEATITCLFKNGKRQVPAHKILGFEQGAWQFDNGYSKSCEFKVVKK